MMNLEEFEEVLTKVAEEINSGYGKVSRRFPLLPIYIWEYNGAGQPKKSGVVFTKKAALRNVVQAAEMHALSVMAERERRNGNGGEKNTGNIHQ